VVLAIGITFVAFVLTQLVPGDPALSALGPVTSADPEAVAAYHAHWGMDDPLPVQYGTYLWNLSRTSPSSTTSGTRSPRRWSSRFSRSRSRSLWASRSG
jgi:ABC-type dipeptide/oligopeptide/nickel transport system permease component